MPQGRSLPALAGWTSVRDTVKPLEKLAMDIYLRYLEDACAVYIRLCCCESKLLQFARDNMIQVLKDQLKSNLTRLREKAGMDPLSSDLRSAEGFEPDRASSTFTCSTFPSSVKLENKSNTQLTDWE